MPSYFRLTVGLAAVATAVAVLLRALQPFDHGIWLIAYLLLVGTLAQFLLAWGQYRLAPGTSAHRIRAQALLWMIGVVVVPTGVLVGVRLLVALGSVSLLVSLFLFWRATRAEHRSARPDPEPEEAVAYAALLVFMTLSVFVGMVLASDVPWL